MKSTTHTKQKLPSKKEMLSEIAQWKWQTQVLLGQTSPWLVMPGLVVFVETKDLSDLDERFDVFMLAMKQLRKHPIK